MIKNVIKDKHALKVNLGIELLRSILCFWVLCSHCTLVKKEHIKYFYRSFHVPTFLMLSFYFYYRILNQRAITKIKSRFIRLLYPYILWSIVVFSLNNILNKFSTLGNRIKQFSLKDLYLQILTGSKYYRVFWFQFNLIFLSQLFAIFSFVLKRNLIIFLELLGIISLFLLFSKINSIIFFPYAECIRMSVGRLNSSLPLAIIGCIYGSYNLLLKINNLNWHLNVILLSLVYILFKYDIFIIYPGFAYSNTLLYIFASTILFILFGSIKVDKFIILNKIIKIITKYTGGIYYIHRIFPSYIFLFFNVNKISYFYSFLIYISF